jgi:hypothetical protein
MDSICNEYKRHIQDLEKKTGRIFGCTDGKVCPLLLSVRASTIQDIPGYV